jgi:hypothetical protein
MMSNTVYSEFYSAMIENVSRSLHRTDLLISAVADLNKSVLKLLLAGLAFHEVRTESI